MKLLLSKNKKLTFYPSTFFPFLFFRGQYAKVLVFVGLYLTLSIQPIFSQRVFQGEIVTLEKDTLRGEIWFGHSGKLPTEVSRVYFSEDGQKVDRFPAKKLVSISLVHDITNEKFLYLKTPINQSNTLRRVSKENLGAKTANGLSSPTIKKASFEQACCYRKYKGIFAGINLSTSHKIPVANGVHLGWHIGYALRGDLQKKVAPQLELLASLEGFKTNVEEVNVVLAYLKAPLMTSIRPGYNNNFRLVFGLQPTFYMGGFAKERERLYSPSYFLDCETSVQPSIEGRLDLNDRIRPRLWNLEGVCGFETFGKHLNFGIRLNAGFFSNNRFQNSGVSFRAGF